MEKLFIEAKWNGKVKLNESEIDKLPHKICLATTVQFIDCLADIRKQIEATSRRVSLVKGKHTKYEGQMLGCDIGKCEHEAVLYIGDGMFHPKMLKIAGKDVYVLNPLNGNLSRLEKSDVDRINTQRKAAYSVFLSSNEIGVLVSVKEGQNQLKKALKLKEKLAGKNVYIFMCDTLDFNELENFPFIGCWVNTMCPRIGLDDAMNIEKAIVNIDDVL